MYIPKTPYTDIALQSLLYYLIHRSLKNLILHNIPSGLYGQKRGCFVSLHRLNDDLRGCIGTIEPREENLVMEISRNAVSAAMNDSRFKPIKLREMEGIKLSVDILSKPEFLSDINDLDPQVFGVIVSDGSCRKAILLPGLEGIDTIEKQLIIVKRKAGLSEIPDEKLIFHRFTSNRYS
jgi:uncharacterized protein